MPVAPTMVAVISPRHILLLTCFIILSDSGALGKGGVRGPGAAVPDGWATTSDVARSCLVIPDGTYDPPAACKEAMSIEGMSDKKKTANMCMMPVNGGPTVTYEAGTTNVKEWTVIRASG